MKIKEAPLDLLPVWGGIECTVHRFKNDYGDQIMRSGHHHRNGDLQRIAALGIKTLRYPIIWEKIALQGLAKADWSWIDKRLDELQDLGITPIASLLHHGSGPAYTSLIDPDFPHKFTEFAVAVAQRYPWLELFTPINEPLTTARFSCLYGVWYPHTYDDHAFSLAILHQCKATIMAMQEIKKINPAAQLVQTEDLGKCHATKKMQYQCDFENERRWLSLDLLTGALSRNQVMVDYFLKKGRIGEKELDYFYRNSFAPDIIGINHYITSERFLDENRKKYPGWSRSYNGKHTYCDVDIVRADIHKREGHYRILKSAIDRYQLPIAITEVHLGSHRDAQLRWFMEAYNAAAQLKAEGHDVRAVTAWSLLGAYDWNTLLTQKNNFYEPGVFDIRSGEPRATAIASVITDLNNGVMPTHPVLQAEGWWKNPEHVHFMFSREKNARGLPAIEMMFPENLLSSSIKPILITGAAGTLGRAFAHICTIRNISYIMLERKDLDITDKSAIETLLEKYQPWAVINTAGFVRVDDAEIQRDDCFLKNSFGAALLADVCARYGIQYVTFSSDLVFDGASQSPYTESSPTAPLNIYGESKCQAETQVLQVNPAALVVRTSAFFGPWDEYNFITQMIATLERGQPFFAAQDVIISPTYVPDLINNCLDLMIDNECGIWHLANASALSWADFALKAATLGKLDKRLIKSIPIAQLGLPAKRPKYSALGTEKGIVLPDIEDAIHRYFFERIVS